MLMNYVISTILGVFASIAAWFLVFHGLPPKLRFSDKISKREADDEPGGIAYRIKLENDGCRAIIDLSIVAKLRIRGLNLRYPLNYEVTYLPVSFQGEFPYVEPARKKNNRPLIRISVRKENEFTRSIYPTKIREKAARDALTLEDLLSIDPTATVQLIAIGNDSFSWARKAFSSPEYVIEDIVDRPFKRYSLEVED